MHKDLFLIFMYTPSTQSHLHGLSEQRCRSSRAILTGMRATSIIYITE